MPAVGEHEVSPYWAEHPNDVARGLHTDTRGLTSSEASKRLETFGSNELRVRRAASRLRVAWRQVRSPLVLLLVFAAIASLFTSEWVDAALVGAILVLSIGVGYLREYRAETAIAALLERIQMTSDVIRDGQRCTVPVGDIVPGDVFLLAPGSMVPADGILVEAEDLHIDEATLTGESFPVLKRVGPVAAKAPLRSRRGCVQFGTNVRSGTGRALAVSTGARTAFGAIEGQLATHAPETEFERGLRRFGLLLLVAMLVMVICVFAVNVMLGRPPIETLLFSFALAVGLSPELLPAIVGVNLSRAAQLLANEGVLVRHLDALENLGSMDVLCTDKTGTLTEGIVYVEGAYDARGASSDVVLDLAVANAALQAGLQNPLDRALLAARTFDARAFEKVGEVPYDFTRKRLSVIVRRPQGITIITKGAVASVLGACTRLVDGTPLDGALRAELDARHQAWSGNGARVLAVATRALPLADRYSHEVEHDLELVGFVTLSDRPKPDAAAAIAALTALGVRTKMITGDSRFVARHVAAAVGLTAAGVLDGEQLRELTDVDLVHLAASVDVFAEVDPTQKERLLRALRRGGAVVGFFGDGVNDAPAMHFADVSLSVESAVDVARATADLVMTRKSLDVIRRGIQHGRYTFANTLKYILTTTSANLGNMISMAVASLVLPFLPLTAGQILLNNFLSDVPAIGIAGDRVDPESVARPHRWDMRFIGRFMLEFGLLSSLFDALTFVILIVGFDANVSVFRTGWFVESLFTELVIALVVRTRRRAWRSRPGAPLLWTSVAVATLAFALPYLPFAAILGFTRPPSAMMAAIIVITLAYVLASEALKSWFYRADHRGSARALSRGVLASDQHRRPRVTHDLLGHGAK
jgi:Mg2+-importing ATPase